MDLKWVEFCSRKIYFTIITILSKTMHAHWKASNILKVILCKAIPMAKGILCSRLFPTKIM